MASGRINSPESVKLAGEVVRAFGGWAEVERAARRGDDGIWRISRAAFERARRENLMN